MRARCRVVLAGHPAGPPAPRAAARFRSSRPLHRRRRLHRAVGGAARQGADDPAASRPARGRPMRRGRQRPQRRLPERVADPRAENGLARFASEIDSSSGSDSRTSTSCAPTWSRQEIDCDYEATGELESRSSRTARRSCDGGRGARCAASATTSTCSTPARCGPRSTRRCTSAALWTGRRGARPPRQARRGLRAAAVRPACGSSRQTRVPVSGTSGAACRC